jgi:hypothetical protein
MPGSVGSRSNSKEDAPPRRRSPGVCRGSSGSRTPRKDHMVGVLGPVTAAQDLHESGMILHSSPRSAGSSR